jgi:hypothetical protein
MNIDWQAAERRAMTGISLAPQKDLTEEEMRIEIDIQTIYAALLNTPIAADAHSILQRLTSIETTARSIGYRDGWNKAASWPE